MGSRLIAAGPAVAILAVGALAAQAADPKSLPPVYRQMPISIVAAPCMACDTWSGVYFGLNGGYGFGKSNYIFAPGGGAANLFAPDAGGGFSQSTRGHTFGGHVGFNRQWAGIVAGLEASLDWAGVKKATVNPFATTPRTANYETRVKWFGALTPRLGYATRNFLFYGKGGFAFAGIESQLTSTALGGRRFMDASDHIGWTLGGGLEWAVMSNWIVGVEYDHYAFRAQSEGGMVTPGTGSPVSYQTKPSFGAVMARASYKLAN